MSNIAFTEIIHGEKVFTSHTEKKKVGDRVVYYGDFYKIIAIHGIGKTFSVTLEPEIKGKRIS